jgi:hypothetical protein
VLHKIKGKILVGIGIIFWGFGPIELAYSRHFFLLTCMYQADRKVRGHVIVY